MVVLPRSSGEGEDVWVVDPSARRMVTKIKVASTTAARLRLSSNWINGHRHDGSGDAGTLKEEKDVADHRIDPTASTRYGPFVLAY